MAFRVSRAAWTRTYFNPSSRVNVWSQRPVEEQRLLNPGFCSMLLWHSAIGNRKESPDSGPLPFAKAFLILPTVLHGGRAIRYRG